MSAINLTTPSCVLLYQEDFWEGASEIAIRQTPLGGKGRRNVETCSTTSEESAREVKRTKTPSRKSAASAEETLRRRLNVLYKSVYDCQVGDNRGTSQIWVGFIMVNMRLQECVYSKKWMKLHGLKIYVYFIIIYLKNFHKI